jgi:hypothetical protein
MTIRTESVAPPAAAAHYYHCDGRRNQGKHRQGEKHHVTKVPMWLMGSVCEKRHGLSFQAKHLAKHE